MLYTALYDLINDNLISGYLIYSLFTFIYFLALDCLFNMRSSPYKELYFPLIRDHFANRQPVELQTPNIPQNLLVVTLRFY